MHLYWYNSYVEQGQGMRLSWDVSGLAGDYELGSQVSEKFSTRRCFFKKVLKEKPFASTLLIDKCASNEAKIGRAHV